MESHLALDDEFAIGYVPARNEGQFLVGEKLWIAATIGTDFTGIVKLL
jgi:hypothetical protein